MFSLIKAFDWWDMKPTDPSNMFKDLKHKRTEESGETDDYFWKSEDWSSEDGTAKFTRKVYTSKPRERTENLKAELDKAIAEQRFEDAIKIRDKINEKKQG